MDTLKDCLSYFFMILGMGFSGYVVLRVAHYVLLKVSEEAIYSEVSSRVKLEVSAAEQEILRELERALLFGTELHSEDDQELVRAKKRLKVYFERFLREQRNENQYDD